jgi:hypothetical protein
MMDNYLYQFIFTRFLFLLLLVLVLLTVSLPSLQPLCPKMRDQPCCNSRIVLSLTAMLLLILLHILRLHHGLQKQSIVNAAHGMGLEKS